MSGPNSLVADLRSAAAPDPRRVSNTNWKPAGDVIAEALGLDPTDVYLATVSKAGNLGVRFGQSRQAREATVVGAMYNGTSPVELGRIADAAARHAAEEDRDVVLVFAGSPSWNLELVVTPKQKSTPAVLGAAWPQATAVSV